jgi:fatty acid-binding protein DegV
MSTIPEPAGQEARTGVAVVTDSTTYLPQALLQRWQIAQVSLYVGWDGEHRPEGEYELEDFYSRLRSSPNLPSTSQPSVGDFLAVYEPLAVAGRDVVSIHIAAGLSGTCESAREAARTIADRGLPGRVEVLDGETGAGGWIVQHAQLPEEAASLVATGEEILGSEPLFCTEVGPVLGAHLGSGMLVGGVGCAPTTAA